MVHLLAMLAALQQQPAALGAGAGQSYDRAGRSRRPGRRHGAPQGERRRLIWPAGSGPLDPVVSVRRILRGSGRFHRSGDRRLDRHTECERPGRAPDRAVRRSPALPGSPCCPSRQRSWCSTGKCRSSMPASRSLVGAAPYAANDDRRYDQVVWSSDAPAVVAVSTAGRLSAGRQGRATITARAGRAAQSFTVDGRS